MAVHKLKTWPEPFDAIIAGVKTFEYRRDDRAFAIGDILVLERFDPFDGPTGARLAVEVTYLLRGVFGIPQGYACMSIRKLSLIHNPVYD